ncbi:hypothetical protein [Shewanella frigidimarina]|uniref:hypothetical protein n=1 Tax=Shewanella frigidimarina TaxID=56812 RepID=UPI003D7BBBF1
MLIKNEPAVLDWAFKRGDDYGCDLQYCRIDGTPEDLTGFTITGMARENAHSPKLYDIPITITNAIEGRCEITFTGEFTGALGITGRPQEMKYDIQIVSPEGITLTFIIGTIKVEGDYTRIEGAI